MNGWLNACMDGWMGEWVNEWMGEWMGGGMGGWIFTFDSFLLIACIKTYGKLV